MIPKVTAYFSQSGLVQLNYQHLLDLPVSLPWGDWWDPFCAFLSGALRYSLLCAGSPMVRVESLELSPAKKVVDECWGSVANGARFEIPLP